MKNHRIMAFWGLLIVGFACTIGPVRAQSLAVSYEDGSSSTPKVQVAGNMLAYTWLTGKPRASKPGFHIGLQEYQGHMFRTRLTWQQAQWLRQWMERNRLFALKPYYSRANTHIMVAGDLEQRLLLADGRHRFTISWWPGSRIVPGRLTSAVSQLVAWAEAVRDENAKTTRR